MQTQTRDPVMAVVLHTQADHTRELADHEARIRPLEKLRAQIGILAFLGSMVGGALVNYLFSR